LSNLLVYGEVLCQKNESCSRDVAFLDMVKAFDKVLHIRILKKLRKHGIGGKTLRILSN